MKSGVLSTRILILSACTGLPRDCILQKGAEKVDCGVGEAKCSLFFVVKARLSFLELHLGVAAQVEIESKV